MTASSLLFLSTELNSELRDQMLSNGVTSIKWSTVSPVLPIMEYAQSAPYVGYWSRDINETNRFIARKVAKLSKIR